MTIQAPLTLTSAETALIDTFAGAFGRLPGNADVTTQRSALIKALKTNGLPTRRIETWHYTDLRRLLQAVPKRDGSAHIKPLAPVIGGSVVLPVVNGVAIAQSPAVAGVTVRPVSEMLVDGSFAPALNPRDEDDAIGALNTAFVSDGWFVDIAEGTRLETAIELQNVHAGGQTHVRLPVRVGAAAKVTIVERQSGNSAALATSVANLLVGDDAEVLWLIVQDQPDTATHLAQFNAELGKNARLTLFIMNAGGKLVRQEVRVGVSGEGSDFQLRGVNLLAGETHTDITMVLDHTAPHTGSRELIRNIVTGKAHGVFQGRINVHQRAQKTDAKMACNTLLLSDEAEFSTKPELEIFADDVQCGHGATMTEIDRKHLFYLKSRGVSDKTARGLLVKAFAASVIEELEDEAIVEALETRLEEWFATHG